MWSKPGTGYKASDPAVACPQCGPSRTLAPTGSTLGELCCNACAGTWLPLPAARWLLFEHLRIQPESFRGMVSRAGPGAVLCTSCRGATSRVPMGRHHAEVCGHCGALWLREGVLHDLTGGRFGVMESTADEITPPFPAAVTRQLPPPRRLSHLTDDSASQDGPTTDRLYRYQPRQPALVSTLVLAVAVVAVSIFVVVDRFKYRCPQGTTRQGLERRQTGEVTATCVGEEGLQYYLRWDEKRRLVSLERRVGDKRHGGAQYWYPNGNLAEEGQYLEDRKSGRWVRYAEDGTRSEEIPYRDGVPQGVSTLYHVNGNKKAEGLVDKDGWHGKWNFWDEQGNLLRVEDLARQAPPPVVQEDVRPVDAPDAAVGHAEVFEQVFGGRSLAWWHDRLRQLAQGTSVEERNLFELTCTRAAAAGLVVERLDGGVGIEVRADVKEYIHAHQVMP